MGAQHREAIFSLRATIDPATIGKPGTPNGRIYSLQKIAATLGISKALVQKELGRTAAGPAPGEPDTPPAAYTPGPLDPLAQARQAFQLEQLEAQRVTMRAQRLEAEKRLELLAKGGGDSNGAMLLVISELKDLGKRIEQVATRPALPPAAAPAPLYEQLSELRSGWEAVKTIGGDAKPPTTAEELQVKIALDRLTMEGEERRRRIDFELEDLRRQRDNDRIRSEAWAEQVRQWGPLLMQGAQNWFAQQRSTGGEGGAGNGVPGTAPTRPSTAPQLTALPGGAAVQPAALGIVEGPCPSCGVALRFRPTPGDDGRCPSCQMELAVVNGKIWPKLAAPREGSGALPSIAG